MIRLILSFFTCLVLSFSISNAQAEKGSPKIQIADAAVKAKKFNKAYKKYKKILEKSSENKHALIGVAYTAAVLGINEQSKIKKEKYFLQSRDYARKAYALSSMSTDANYMMAMILDKQADLSNATDRMQLAQDIKKHVDYTLRFEKNNSGAYFLLGRSYYLLATLPFDTRSTDTLPVHASLNKAIESFQKAITLNPKRVLYHYALALAYEEDLRSEEALAAVNQALSLNPTPEDGGDDILMRCQELKFMIN